MLALTACDDTSTSDPGDDAGIDASQVDASQVDASQVDASQTDAETPASCGWASGSGCSGGAVCIRHVAGTATSTSCGSAGSVAAGAACSADGDCAEGLLCGSFAGATGKTCHVACAAQSTTCPGNGQGATCAPIAMGGADGWCTAACTPGTNAGCAAASTCVAAVYASVFVATACVEQPGTGVVGAACQSSLDCGAGLLCNLADVGGAGTCAKACNPSDATPCSGGETCDLLANSLSFGGVSLNLCH